MEEIVKDAVFYDESGGGVTFSGGEPLMQPEALREILLRCRERNYHTTIDTCGYADPSALGCVMELANLWLFDLKLIDDSKHLKYTGISNVIILKNLETLAMAGKEIIIRLPVIPGVTDGTGNVEAIAKLMIKLGLTKIDLLPYHAIARDKYRRLGKVFQLDGLKEPVKERVDEVRNFFTGNGFTVGIGG